MFSKVEKRSYWAVIKEHVSMYMIKTIMYFCGTILSIIGSLAAIVCMGVLYDYGDHKNVGIRSAGAVVCVLLAIGFGICACLVITKWLDRMD